MIRHMMQREMQYVILYVKKSMTTTYYHHENFASNLFRISYAIITYYFQGYHLNHPKH